MDTKVLANGLLVAVLITSSGIATAQSSDRPADKPPESPSMGMQPMPGMRGPGSEQPSRGMMDRGMGGGMMGACPMMGGGMMGGSSMTRGGMMGGSPMMSHLPAGNEKLAMRIHGEMMVAIGNILIKNADSVQSKPAN